MQCSSVRPKSSYINNATVGSLIAFKVNETKMLSAKIEEVGSNNFVVMTKNGIRFNVLHRDVTWVKTGDRWPKGIYLALKGIYQDAELKTIDQGNKGLRETD